MKRDSRVYIGATATLVVIVVIAIVAELVLGTRSPGVMIKGGELSDVQGYALDLKVQLSQVLLGWSVGIVAGAAFFLKLQAEGAQNLKQCDVILVGTVILLAILSLFLGQTVIDYAARILLTEQYPLDKERFNDLCRGQYLTLLISVSVFGFHVVQFFWSRAEWVRYQQR